MGSSREVAGGHHQRPSDVREQQVVQGGVRRASGRRAGCPGRPPGPAAPARAAGPARSGRSTDASSRRRVGVGSMASASRLARSRTITANGFSVACASGAAGTASGEVASQARWKPPSPFTATMFPAGERRPHVADEVRARGECRSGVSPSQSRAAHRAGVRLRVEASIERGRRTRAGRPRTSRSRPSSSPAGRTARRGRW